MDAHGRAGKRPLAFFSGRRLVEVDDGLKDAAPDLMDYKLEVVVVPKDKGRFRPFTPKGSVPA